MGRLLEICVDFCQSEQSYFICILLSFLKLTFNYYYFVDVMGQKIDFYRSPWISETKQCLPLLQQVKESTNTLLDQWPDFPTLKDVSYDNNCSLNILLHEIGCLWHGRHTFNSISLNYKILIANQAF